jgi:hypothetical protein
MLVGMHRFIHPVTLNRVDINASGRGRIGPAVTASGMAVVARRG